MLRISCASRWFLFTQLHQDARSTEHKKTLNDFLLLTVTYMSTTTTTTTTTNNKNNNNTPARHYPVSVATVASKHATILRYSTLTILLFIKVNEKSWPGVA